MSKRLAWLILLLPLSAAAQDYNIEGRPRGASAPTWSSVGTFLTASLGSTSGTWSPTTSAQLDANNIGVCVFGADELGTGTTNGTGNAQFTSLTDAASNTWTEAYEWCNMRTSTVADGSCSAVYWTKATSNLASAASITLTTSGAGTQRRRAAACWEFASTGTISEAAGENGLANNSADPGSMTVATGVSKEHLFIRVSSCESNVTTYTADTDYTTFTHTSSTIVSGTSATSHGTRGEFKIETASTSTASDPTYATADCSSAMIALDAS